MRRIVFFLLTFGCVHVTFLSAQMYNLAVCAIFKNEAPYLEEWIEYHKLVGVEHFYLYNNGSEDNFLKILTPYIDAGEVTLVHWEDRSSNLLTNKIWAWVYSTQKTAYENAFSLAKHKTKWIAVIDMDEFLVPIQKNTVVEVLAQYEEKFPGVEIAWDMFGTSNLDVIPSNKLLIELLRRKSPENHPLNSVTKTILKPEMFKEFYHPPHKCNYINGQVHYSISKEDMIINHYTNRCNAYFYVNKLKNKQKMDNVKYDREQIVEMLELGNDEVDVKSSIQRFVPMLRRKMKMSHL